MYVAVQHRITDPDRFFSGDPQEVAENGPNGVRGRQFCPSQDKTVAVCLWEGPSVDAVRDYLESIIGDSSENTYFEVDPEYAMGLPEPATASA
jgi:hypothetical protein